MEDVAEAEEILKELRDEMLDEIDADRAGAWAQEHYFDLASLPARGRRGSSRCDRAA